MDSTQFKVVFVTDLIEEVYALGVQEAKILAQANQIKMGHQYEVKEMYWRKRSHHPWQNCERPF